MGAKLGLSHRLRFSKNRVLRKIFGPKRDEVTGEWGRLHNEELCDLCCSTKVLRVIKSRSLRWTGHAPPMGERGGAYKDLVGKPRERDQLEDPDVDGCIILR